MIRVTFDKNSVTVKGHAEFATSGNDIVCASVSTLIMFTCNVIESLGLKDNISYEESDGYARIIVLKEDEKISKVFNALEFSLRDLENQFPKNVTVK